MCTRKLLMGLFILLLSGHVFAAEGGGEHGAEKGAEKSGEKNAEGGEKKELPEWVEIQVQLSSLETRISAKKENIAHLIEEKQVLPANSPQIKTVIEEMVADHKEMLRLMDEYNKKMTVFKFRFPERGAKEERKYGPQENKSLEQMEKELGLDGRLNRNMKKVRSQYGEGNKEKQSEVEIPTEKSTEPTHEKSIEDSGAIILKK